MGMSIQNLSQPPPAAEAGPSICSPLSVQHGCTPLVHTFILQLISLSCAGVTVQLPTDHTMQLINTTTGIKKTLLLMGIGSR